MTAMQTLAARLDALTTPVLPVIAVDRAEEIIPLGETLLDNGIGALEITLRSAAGIDALALAVERFPDAIILAGTVTNPQQLAAVQACGVDGALSPGITAELLEAAAASDLPFIPGIATASELMFAQSFGFQRCKLFPATVVGGVAMLKSLAGPFAEASFCPTGGLNAANYREFTALNNVFCVGGSWMVVHRDGKFDAAATVEVLRETVA